MHLDFSGGDPYDLSIIHNVYRASVYDSVWGVVDCINQCTTLSFSFPSLTEQQDICAGYKRRSWINLPNIIGAIDGMLVWVKNLPLKLLMMSNVDKKLLLFKKI